MDISIHALLAESDNHATLDAGGNDLFLSTLSLRRATVGQIACGEPITAISIHALLAESDYSMGRNEKSFRGYFYPRSPCGERLRGWTLNINGPIFLSTLSLRRATPTQQRKTKTNEFLSTLSLRRATRSRKISTRPCQFLSTLSLRRATHPDAGSI